MAPLRFSTSFSAILLTLIALSTTALALLSTNSALSSQATLRGDTNPSLSCYNALSPNTCWQGFVTLHKRLPPNSTTISTTTLIPNISKQTTISTTSSSPSPTPSLLTSITISSQVPTTSTMLSTSSQIATPSASTTPFTIIPATPTPTKTPPQPTKTNKFPTISLWVGISFGLLFLALIIFLLLCLESNLYQHRLHAKLMSTIPKTPHQGLRTLHLPQIIHNKKGKANRRSRVDYDGRRVRVVDLDIEGNGEGIQSMEAGRRNREAFETWKRKRGFGAGWSEDVEAVKREEIIQESSQDTGRKMERRKTYEAWKKGVVPPLKENTKRGSIGPDEDFEIARMPDSGA